MLRQLTDQDAMFLYLETEATPAHVGGLSLVDLPAGYRGNFFEDYKATIASRIALVPFLHSKLARIPFDLDRPFWVEDEHIDLDYHIRHAAVPAPGTLRELEALVAELHGQPLDRHRPLWEFTVIDGLASGQKAIYTKMHHAAMDGAASQQLITTMYDPTPVPRVLAPPLDDVQARRGSLGNMLRGLVRHRVQQAVRAVQYVPELLAAVSHVVLPDAATLRFRPMHRVPLTPSTLLNVAITPWRAYAARTVPLSGVKQLAKLTGTTVNDVVLAICSSALRGHLGGKRALPARSLTAMVPVSTRTPGDYRAANQNAMVVCSLASDIADPYERLLAIHRSMIEQKQNIEVWKEFPTPDLLTPGIGAISRRLITRYGRSRFCGRPPLLGNLVISNVPGPPAPLYIAGARIASMFPCSMPFHGQAVNITIESYLDRLDFGLIACRRAVPDLAQLADRLPAAFAELQRAVEQRFPVAAPQVAAPQVAAPQVAAPQVAAPQVAAPQVIATPVVPLAIARELSQARPRPAELPT
jgi:WS/DGAT/MGAT family acyltransferase